MPTPSKPVLHRLDMAVYISDDPSTGLTGAPQPSVDFSKAVRGALISALPGGVLVGPVSVDLTFDYETSVSKSAPKPATRLPSDWRQLAEEAGFGLKDGVSGAWVGHHEAIAKLEKFAKLLLGVK